MIYWKKIVCTDTVWLLQEQTVLYYFEQIYKLKTDTHLLYITVDEFKGVKTHPWVVLTNPDEDSLKSFLFQGGQSHPINT